MDRQAQPKYAQRKCTAVNSKWGLKMEQKKSDEGVWNTNEGWRESG